MSHHSTCPHYLGSYGLEESLIPSIGKALTIAQQRDDVTEIGLGLCAMGNIARANNRIDVALDYHEQSLIYFRQLDDPFYTADALAQLAACYQAIGDFEKSQYYGNQSLDLRKEIDDYIGIFWCLIMQASHLLWVGAYDEARHSLSEALNVILADNADNEFALPHARANRFCNQLACTWLGIIALLQGDHETAQMCYEVVDPGELQLTKFIGNYSPLLLPGLYTTLNGNYATGKQLLSWVHAGLVNEWWLDTPFSEWGLALVHVGLGNMDQAQEHIKVVLQVGLSQHSNMLLSLALPIQALILARQGDNQRAIALLGLAFNPSGSATRWMEKWPLLDRLMAQLKAELGENAFAEAWDRGSKLDLEATFQLLLRKLNPTDSSPNLEANQQLAEPLSRRELEVLMLIENLTNREIAEEFTISRNTIRKHVNNIYGKLGVNSREEAVKHAREIGLIP